MRKFIFRATLALLVVFFLGLLGLLYWLQGDGFRNWVTKRINRELQTLNLCVKSGELRTNPLALQAEYDNLEIATCQDNQLLFSTRHLFIQVKVISLFERKFELQDLLIDQPQIFIKFDAAGNSNLASIKLPTDSDTTQKPEITVASAAVSQGKIFYDDAQLDFNGQFEQLTISAIAQLRPNKQSSNQINIATRSSRLQYQGRDFQMEQLAVRARIYKDRAEIDNFSFKSDFGELLSSGQITNWQQFNYDLRVYSKLDLTRASAIFIKKYKLDGTTTIRGNLTGRRGEFLFQGDLGGSDMQAFGITTQKLGLNPTVKPDKDLFLISGIVQLSGAQYDRVTVSSLQGAIRVTANYLELNDFTANMLGGQVRGRGRLEYFDKPSFVDASVSGLDLPITTDQILRKTSIISGNVDGQIKLRWPHVHFPGLSGELAVKLNGQTQATDRQPDAVPLNGDIIGSFTLSKFEIQEAKFHTPNTDIAASGLIESQGIKLRASLDTTNIDEAQRVFEQSGLLNVNQSEANAEPVMSLKGRGRFEGDVTGTLAEPAIDGNATVASVETGPEELGSFAGRVRYNPGELAISNGNLSQSLGGRARINFTTRLVPGGQTVADLAFQNFRLSQTVVKTARDLIQQTDSANKALLIKVLRNFNGEVDGLVDLKGLPSFGDLNQPANTPASRLNRTPLNFQNFNGKLELDIKNSHPQGSVRALSVKFAVQQNQLGFERIDVSLPVGNVAGSAYYNMQTRDYKVDLNSNNIDLAGLSETLAKQSGPLLVTAKLTGSGNTDRPVFDLKMASQQLTLAGQQLRDLALTAQAREGAADLQLQASYQNRPYQISGQLKLSDDLPLNAEIALYNRSLIPFIELFTTVPPRLEAMASGTIRIRGPLSSPEGLGFNQIKVVTDLNRLMLSVKATNDEDLGYVVNNDGDVVIEASANQVNFQQFNIKGEGTSLAIKGTLAANNSSALNLRGQANLRLLNTLSDSLFVDGLADISAVINTTTGKPRFSGSADLKGVSVRYIGIPLAVEEGSGRVLFTANRALLENFTAKSGSGQLRMDGGLIFENGRASRFRFDMKADSVRLNYPERVRSLIDGNLILQGSTSLQVLSGTVNVRRAEYTDNTDLASLLAVSAMLAPSDIRYTSTLSLDVNVNAQDALVVRNNLADMVGSASIKLSGPITDPIISGRASVSRGQLFLRNDQYNVTRGIVDFPATRSGQARFDIEADTDLRGYRVILNLVGTSTRFSTTLRSEPSLPQADIVALLTTGQLPPPGVSTQARDSQVRLGTALTVLSESLSERVEQRTGRLFGLNRFQIDPLLAGRGSDPTARITLGRRITKNLSLTYSTNVTTGQEQIVVIEYQVNKNVSVIGTRDQDGSYGFDIRFRKRF